MRSFTSFNYISSNRGFIAYNANISGNLITITGTCLPRSAISAYFNLTNSPDPKTYTATTVDCGTRVYTAPEIELPIINVYDVVQDGGLLTPKKGGSAMNTSAYVGGSSGGYLNAMFVLKVKYGSRPYGSPYAASQFSQGVTISMTNTPAFFSFSSTPNGNGEVNVYVASNGSSVSAGTTNYVVTATCVAMPTVAYSFNAQITYIPTSPAIFIGPSNFRTPFPVRNQEINLLDYVSNYGDPNSEVDMAAVRFSCVTAESTINGYNSEHYFYGLISGINSFADQLLNPPHSWPTPNSYSMYPFTYMSTYTKLILNSEVPFTASLVFICTTIHQQTSAKFTLNINVY